MAAYYLSIFLILGLYSWYCFLSSPLFNFFFPTVVLVLNTLVYLNTCKGLLSFGLNWFLVCLMSLSLGGLVCLKLWRLFRWVLCVCPRSPFFSKSYTSIKGTAENS